MARRKGPSRSAPRPPRSGDTAPTPTRPTSSAEPQVSPTSAVGADERRRPLFLAIVAGLMLVWLAFLVREAVVSGG